MKERVVVETENSIHGDAVKWKRLSNISHQMLRPVERQKDQQYTRIGLYNRGRGIFHKPAVIGSDLGDSEFFYVSDGDFVISGQFAWEGAVALARNKEAGCIASHRYPILRGIESIVLSSFLFSFFRSSYSSMLLDVHSRGAAGRNRPLNAERLFREYVPVPSLHTQHKISEVLEEEFALSDTIEREIELLREYRTRLISDVVTGKLDVRAAAATLPDEPSIDSLVAAHDVRADEADEALDTTEDV